MLREMNAPVVLKYMAVAFFACTWKWFYYAPNTYKELKLAQFRRKGQKIPSNINPAEQITFKSALMGESSYYYSFSELMAVVLLPYLLFHFFLTPLPFLFLGRHFGFGKTLYWNAVKNLFLAELLTNVHGFLAVVTNHAGDDMYRFRKGCRPFSGSFFLRQVLASVDYSMGTDAVDFFHGWLNYQIEHHMWPNLSMLSYQKSAPLVEEICRRHGVPYIKQNVFLRLKKTVDIMVGNTSMRWFPEEFEDSYLETDIKIEKAALKSE
jgi:fatty acid desaturase